MVVRSGREMPLVLYDDEWNLRAVLPYLKDGYRLPLHSGLTEHKIPCKKVILFGNAAEYSVNYPDAEKVFVSPPEFFELPEDAKKID